jgi:hypothetical protein
LAEVIIIVYFEVVSGVVCLNDKAVPIASNQPKNHDGSGVEVFGRGRSVVVSKPCFSAILIEDDGALSVWHVDRDRVFVVKSLLFRGWFVNETAPAWGWDPSLGFGGCVNGVFPGSDEDGFPGSHAVACGRLA